MDKQTKVRIIDSDEAEQQLYKCGIFLSSKELRGQVVTKMNVRLLGLEERPGYLLVETIDGYRWWVPVSVVEELTN